MTELQSTFDILTKTSNPCAVDVLIAAMDESSAEIRRRALKALVGRGDARSAESILEHWDRLGGDDIELIREQKKNFAGVVESWIQAGGQGAAQAIKAAEQLQLTSSLSSMITLAESSDSPSIRRQSGDAVLRLVDSMGHRARENRDLLTVRGPVLARLLDSLQSYSMHRSESLVDAFLAVSAWPDGDLRALLETPSPVRDLICHQFRNTVEPGPIELLAGFVRRRDLPACIGEIIEARDDQPFRDALLRQIGSEPAATTLKNLRNIGLPHCCRGGESLVEEIETDQLPALIYLYVAASQDRVEKLQVIAAAAQRGGEQVMSAAAIALADCESPDAEFWMRAAIPVADGHADRIATNENARLLDRLIRLLEHADGGLVRNVREVLSPLMADNVISRLESLRPRSRRRLGKVIAMIDRDAIARVKDALRHPVLSHRLHAIEMADALAAVDTLAESLAHIVREDHQDARIRAAEVMSSAEDEVTLKLLEEMTTLPECGVRDAAIAALEKRRSAVLR